MSNNDRPIANSNTNLHPHAQPPTSTDIVVSMDAGGIGTLNTIAGKGTQSSAEYDVVMSSKYRPTDSVNASDDIDARSDVLINSVHKTNAPNETISVQLSGVPLDKVVSNNDVQVNTRVGLNDDMLSSYNDVTGVSNHVNEQLNINHNNMCMSRPYPEIFMSKECTSAKGNTVVSSNANISIMHDKSEEAHTNTGLSSPKTDNEVSSGTCTLIPGQQVAHDTAGLTLKDEQHPRPVSHLDSQVPSCGSTQNELRVAQVHTVSSPLLSNYVLLQIQTLKLYAMVDSGAEISCVNPDLLNHREFQKLPIHTSDRDYIETATGDRTKIQGVIYVKGQIKSHNVLCPFYIVPNVQPAIILGRDFLSENEVGLKFATDGTMSMSFNPKRQIVAKEKITVPPKSQVAFIARIRGAPLPCDVTGVTSGSSNLISMGLLPTKSLSVNKHGFIQYSCANFTEKPVVIVKGANLGKFTCLSHQHELYHIPEDDACSQGTSIQEHPKIQTTCKCSGSHEVTCVHNGSPVQERQSSCVNSMDNSNFTPHANYNSPKVAPVQSKN